MNFKKILITSHYLGLLSLLAFQAVATVYQLGQTIGYGQKISQLQQTKHNLAQHHAKLTHQLAKQTALSQVPTEVTQDYQPIRQPIAITLDTTVASR